MLNYYFLLPGLIFVPVAAGLLCLCAGRFAKWLALLIAGLALPFSLLLLPAGEGGIYFYFFTLRTYLLSAGIFTAAAFFTFLTVLYSYKFMSGQDRQNEYYAYILMTLGAAAGVLFASDYLTLLFFWGILAITLYLLIGIGGADASQAAKKTLIIIGGSDALMLFGIALIWLITGTVQIGVTKINIHTFLPVLAFITFGLGVFAKAGVIPLHSWIIDAAETSPLPVMAYLPAALDKLLGIYLLTRLCLEIFLVEPNSLLSILLLAIGSATILVGVMAALVQHNLKKLLSYHAVSQVGYMLLGIGSGIPIAIAGGLFHMFNNTIYKSLLFFNAGAIEKQAKTTELSQLGKLARLMPVTFITTLIAALSIAGVPPFNGFVSKWMIYQGIVELGKISPYWIIWLTAAMFGSALTLASFIKIIQAAFFCPASDSSATVKEVAWQMWLPPVILAALCILFGLFAYQLPLALFIFPVVQGANYIGFWNPLLAAGLLGLGLLGGIGIYRLGQVKTFTAKPAYIGGENLTEKETRVSGEYFYNTVKEWGGLSSLYQKARQKYFDVYQWGSGILRFSSSLLKFLHDGNLQTYLAWMFLGFTVLLFVLMR